jgi:hypothetical protein
MRFFQLIFIEGLPLKSQRRPDVQMYLIKLKSNTLARVVCLKILIHSR